LGVGEEGKVVEKESTGETLKRSNSRRVSVKKEGKDEENSLDQTSVGLVGPVKKGPEEEFTGNLRSSRKSGTEEGGGSQKIDN